MATKFANIRFKQGDFADLPVAVSGTSGEPRFCLDTGQFFISDGTQNVEITPNITNITNAGGASYSQLVTTSGVLQNQIDNLGDTYVTDSELNTVSGIIVAQIPTDFYTTSEVDSIVSTTSGTLQTQIDNLGDTYATDAELLTTSGVLASDLSDHINSDGSSHTYLDQDVTSSAVPTFSGITVVNTINEISTDGTLSGDSDSAIPTEKAVKAYIDAATTSGAVHHGGLTGLGDDDHTQYSLADGTRAFTGTVSGITPTEDAHLTTKQFVDDHTWTESDITDLDKYTQSEVDGLISTTSGSLQNQINNLGDTYATDSELATVSGAINSDLTAHTGDSTIHFTEAEIDHNNILNVGTTTHSGIDAHIADGTLHRVINDSGTGSTELWSADKISTELGTLSADFDEIYGGDFV